MTGLAGALGHSIADDDAPEVAVTICDAGTIDFEALAQRLDPLSTVVFVPSSPALMPPPGILGGFIHVAPRTSLGG